MDFGLSLISCRKIAPFLTTQWVPDHEGSTVGDGVGQSNDSFTYNKKLTQISVWVFFSLDKFESFVYTNSVVNDKGDSIWCKRKREIDTLDLWEVYCLER